MTHRRVASLPASALANRQFESREFGRGIVQRRRKRPPRNLSFVRCDGRQSWIRVSPLDDVVEAGDGHILRRTQSGVMQRTDGAERNAVSDAEQRIDGHAGANRRSDRLAGAVSVGMVEAVSGELVRREPRSIQGVLIPVAAQHREARRRIGHPNDGDVLAPRVDEVCHHRGGGDLVVDGAGFLLAHEVFADQRNGAARADVRDVVDGQPEWADDDAVWLQGKDPVECLQLLCSLTAGLGDHGAEPTESGLLDDAFDVMLGPDPVTRCEARTGPLPAGAGGASESTEPTDPLTVPDAQIDDLKIRSTWVDGKAVYKAK